MCLLDQSGGIALRALTVVPGKQLAQMWSRAPYRPSP